jgi:hypothetical protein
LLHATARQSGSATHTLRRLLLLLLLLLCAAVGTALLAAAAAFAWLRAHPAAALASSVTITVDTVSGVHLGDADWDGVEQGAGDLAGLSLWLLGLSLRHLHLNLVDLLHGLGVLLEVTVVCVRVTVQAVSSRRTYKQEA